MHKPGDEEQLRLIKEFHEGKLHCRLFKTKDHDGGLTTFFTLGRDGRKEGEPLIGGLNDLKRAKDLITQAEKELSREVSREWWPVVQAVRLVEGGAVCRVEKSLPKADQAERFALGKHHLGVFPRPSDAELQPGEELVIRYGDDKRLDRQIRQLRWQEENKGEDYAFARWHDRGSMPEVGQRVNIEALHDYQGEPRDHRATPLTRSIEPGEPEEALYLVIKRDPKIPGLGVVEDTTRVRQDARTMKDDLQAGLDARRQASNNREWAKEDFTPELRRFGVERDDPQPDLAPAEVAAVPPPPERSIVVGSLQATMSETTDTDGRRQRTVKITRTKGGVEHHFECGLEELLEVARQVGGIERAKRQVKEHLLETPHQKEGQEQAAGEQAPKETKAVELRNGHMPAASIAKDAGPAQQAAPVRDHPFWVAGVWHGVEPPKKDQPIWFVTGTGRVQDRVMTPVQGEVRAPGPGEPVRYFIAKVMGDGLALAYGSKKGNNQQRYVKFRDVRRNSFQVGGFPGIRLPEPRHAGSGSRGTPSKTVGTSVPQSRSATFV